MEKKDIDKAVQEHIDALYYLEKKDDAERAEHYGYGFRDGAKWAVQYSTAVEAKAKELCGCKMCSEDCDVHNPRCHEMQSIMAMHEYTLQAQEGSGRG